MLQRTDPARPVGSNDFFLPEFFEGPTHAWGFFEDPFGVVKKAFTADLFGSWEGERFQLREHFQFQDGTREDRTWELIFEADGRFTAQCPGTIEPGTGHHVPNGCQMSYAIKLPVGKRQIAVRFRDLFYQIDDSTLLNRSKVTKWGLPVGQLVICFRRSNT